jgi:thioredoxin-related protein
MNKSKIVLSLSLLFCISKAFCQGVDFQSITLKNALEQAKADNKHVFVMFGTTHCGYSMEAFHTLGNDKVVGEYMNKHFVNVAYGHPDGLNATTMQELAELCMTEEYSIIENNEEVVFTNYFVFPNFFFLDPDGKITYFFNGSQKIEKRILKAAKKGLDPNPQTPLFFRTYFNNKMYPKNKRSFEMLSEGMLAYHQLEFPDKLDFSQAQSIRWEEINLPDERKQLAVKHLENSLEKGDHFFNQFLAAVIYDKSGDHENAILHAQNAMTNYPKHWSEKKRKLIDDLLKQKFDLGSE